MTATDPPHPSRPTRRAAPPRPAPAIWPLRQARAWLTARPRLGFVIVGAEKAGTSALFYYLRRVPGLYGPILKELNFFSRDDRYGDGSDLSALHRWFLLAPKGAILGEASPSYLANPWCLARIRDYNRDIKVIALLRSPVVRAFSAWNFRRARLRDKRDFMTAVEVELASGGDLRVARENKYRYVETGRYRAQLRELFRVFPRENVLVMKYEAFNRDQPEHVRAAVRFVGGPERFEMPRYRRVNAWGYDRKLTRAEFERLLPIYEDDIRAVEAETGWDCADWRRPPG